MTAITDAPTGVAAFIGAAKKGRVNGAVRVASFGEFEKQFGALASGLHLGWAVRQFFVNGGVTAIVVRIANGASAAQVGKGVRALDGIDFNLLALPGISTPAITAAADYCGERRAFLIVDPPETVRTPAAMVAFMESGAMPPSPDAALWFPWTKISDPLANGQPRAIPPSGTIAGLIARTDAARGVWKSPAGPDATLIGVKSLDFNLTDAESETLNARGVNCLRSFPTFGNVAWGARTLAGADDPGSDWKYIAVRRLALFIEESVVRGTQWVGFEKADDEPLWARLRLEVGAFMQSLFVKGAFQGGRPSLAYFVKCDRETMTDADIASGIVNIAVGFAPLRPAEFVVITIRQHAVP